MKIFERNQKRIVLFGTRCWLRERANKDVTDVTVWYKKEKIKRQSVDDDPNLATAFDIFKLTSIADGLKDNVWKFRWWWLLFPPMFVWSWRRNRLWRPEYLSGNLTAPQLNFLLEQLWILEGYEPVSKNGETEKETAGHPVSPEIIRGAIAAVLNVDWFLVPQIPITQYREAQDVAFNLGNWLTGNGDLETETPEDKQQRAELEWIAIKEKMAAEGRPFKPKKKVGENG